MVQRYQNLLAYNFGSRWFCHSYRVIILNKKCKILKIIIIQLHLHGFNEMVCWTSHLDCHPYVDRLLYFVGHFPRPESHSTERVLILFVYRLIIKFSSKAQVLLVRVQEAIRSPVPIKLCWQCLFFPIFLLLFQS